MQDAIHIVSLQSVESQLFTTFLKHEQRIVPPKPDAVSVWSVEAMNKKVGEVRNTILTEFGDATKVMRAPSQ